MVLLGAFWDCRLVKSCQPQPNEALSSSVQDKSGCSLPQNHRTAGSVCQSFGGDPYPQRAVAVQRQMWVCGWFNWGALTCFW